MVQATARHLLVKTEEECASLKQQIIDGADFAELARKHSACLQEPKAVSWLFRPGYDGA